MDSDGNFDMLGYAPPTTAFGLLLLEPEDALTADQRESLEYLLAADDIILGLKPTNAARRWYDMSMQIAVIARSLGRLPRISDPDVSDAHVAWIAQQRHATLNSFQHVRMTEIVGWQHDVAE